MAQTIGARRICGLPAAIAVIAFAGCGEGRLPTFPVTGEVVFKDGSPLKGGRVQFRSVGKDPPVIAQGVFGDDGKFDLQTFDPGDGAPVGKYQVVVAADTPDDRGALTEREYFQALKPIDPAFKSFETSNLEFEVTEDASKNHFRIVVWPPP
jgi:hypothetical protein